MAVDMYLKIDDVKGESQDDKHKGEIDVLSFSWGMSQSGFSQTGAGSGAGKANVNDLSITKYVDKSTPTLMLATCTGKHFKEATLVVRKAGEKPLEYIKLTLKDVLISSLATGGSGGEDRLVENMSLNFGEYKMEYIPQKADGSGEAAQTAAYSMKQNKKI